jgi:hypothetical protein
MAPARPDRRELVYRVALAVLAIAGLSGYAGTHLVSLSPIHGPAVPVVRSDGTGYYSYLPAYLVEKDPTFRTWVATESWRQPNAGLHMVRSTGRYLQQYPAGEAIMVLPFFAAGHVAAKLAGARADGYSPIETGAVGLAGLTYMILGLWLLGRSLRRYFTALVTLAAILSITFGTDLFNYGTFESIFSHAFSFFLLAALIELVHRWRERPLTWQVTATMGIVIGLICEVRQTDAILLLVIPLFGVGSWQEFRHRLALLWTERGHVVGLVTVAAVTFVPQSLIWHESTGHWVINSYPSSAGTFDFASPQLIRLLVSFRPHGVIPWAPILVFAIMGLVPMRRRVRPLFVATVVILILYSYIIASWTYWSGAGAYGDRYFIDVLPLLAFAVGSFYATMASSRSRRLAVGTASIVLCSLVLIQMVNYWQGRLSQDGADLHQYVPLLYHGA